MLFNETSDDFEFNADRYLFAENPVVHLDTAANGAKNNVLSLPRAEPPFFLPANPTRGKQSIYSVSLCKSSRYSSPQPAKSISNKLQFL